MKNSFGNNVIVTLFGESHGEEIGIVIDGLAPGIKINNDFIESQLAKRRPAGKISTARVEQDPYRIVSGVYEGVTTGTPVCILIPNENKKSKDYGKMEFIPRPGHADYAAFCKYHGFQDKRGGGHFSGRITAPIVAAGAIAIDILKSKGILIGSHISKMAEIKDDDFTDYRHEIEKLNSLSFATLNEEIKEKMIEATTLAADEGDSVGGVLETAVVGLPAGLGEPWFDSFEGILSHILFSVPAVKGVEFGDGFALADMKGSEANDAFKYENGAVVTKTNHNGGVNGGITNGMPVIIKTVIKPTPSIYKKQDSVDLKNKENIELEIEGRHDPAIIHRARVVIDSVVALAILDMLSGRFGTDYMVVENER